jgi:hypothetical protein
VGYPDEPTIGGGGVTVSVGVVPEESGDGWSQYTLCKSEYSREIGVGIDWQWSEMQTV